MKRLLTIFCAAIGFAVPARAALTPVARETFQGVGTLTAAAPGAAFPAQTGSFYQRAVGPRLASDGTVGGRGWSADFQGSQSHLTRAIINGAAASCGSMSAWFYVDVIGDGLHSYALLHNNLTGFGDGYNFLSVGYTRNTGNFGYSCCGLSPFNYYDSGVALPYRQWFELRVAWNQISSSPQTYAGGIYYRTAGSNTWITIYENTSFTTYNLTLNTGDWGVFSTDNGTSIRGRMGMPTLYRMDSWADRLALPADVVDPPTGAAAWYVNPATGSDDNDGTTASTAWATVAKINAESRYCGMFPRSGGMDKGDTLSLDGSAAPLLVGSVRLQLRTRGLTFSCAGAEPIRPWTAVTGPWTLSAGCANTYETTDGAAADLASVVVLEDWKILYHPTGASFNAVRAALDATPGGFYSDGAKLYVHPFGDTRPGVDGKTYIRSRARPDDSGIPGGSVICVHAPDVHITSTQPGGSLLRMSMLAQSTDSNPIGSYLLQWDSGGGGRNQVDNFRFDLGSKHLEGRTATASNMSVTRVDCVYGQASGYAGYGGQTQAVDYCQSGTGNTYAYLRCSSTVNAGLFGSSAGAVNTAYPSWLSHGDAGGVFAGGTFTDCRWCSMVTEYGSASGTVSLLRTTLAGTTAFNSNLTADQCQTTGWPLSVQNGKTMILRNCILNVTATTNNFSWAPLACTATIQGVTINFGDNPGGSSPGAVWGRAGTCNLTLRNVLLIADPAHPHTLLDGFTSGDAIVTDHNAYANGSAVVVQRYDDGVTTADRTLAQWQLLGQDAGSFAATAVVVDAGLRPVPLSPLIGAGNDLGSLPDYTGKMFAHRTTIGACEPPPGTYGQWQNDYFTTAQLNDAATSGDLANPAGDGVANLLKYALNLDPGSPAPAGALPVFGADGNFATLTYTKALWAADLTYTVEQSADLIHWTVSAPVCTILTSDGTTQQIRAQVPMGGSSRLFLRLRVSRL